MPQTRTLAIIMLAAGLVAVSPRASAQTNTGQTFERFTGTTVNLSVGTGEALRMDIFRWSSDEDRDRFVLLFGGDPAKFQEALEGAPAAGYIWTSESLGYAVRYAYRLAVPAGGVRIVLITDRRLGAWSRINWMPADRSASPDYKFTLVELRLNQLGRGEGKMSLSTKVVADAEARTLALERYEAAPVLLKSVEQVGGKRGPTGSDAKPSGTKPAVTKP